MTMPLIGTQDMLGVEWASVIDILWQPTGAHIPQYTKIRVLWPVNGYID